VNETRGPQASTVGLVAGFVVATILGLWLVLGTVGVLAEFRWSVEGAGGSDVAPLHIDTRRGHVWLDEPLGEPTTGHAGVGIDVRVRLSVVGRPRRSQITVTLNGPGGWLGRSMNHWTAGVLGGETLDRTTTLSESGIYTLRIEPTQGRPRWSAEVVGTGPIEVAAWRAPAPWSLLPGTALLLVALVAAIRLWIGDDREWRTERWFVLGAVALVLAGIATLIAGEQAVALPVWVAVLGAALMGGATVLVRARDPVLPAGFRAWARRRLGWITTDADGAFRRWRLATVAVTALVAIGLATTAVPAGPLEHGQFDLERGTARGPARIDVMMDTRGAPFRVEAPGRLEAGSGVVGAEYDLDAYFTAGRAPVSIRLTDPQGDVVWKRLAGPGQWAWIVLELRDEGVWHLEFATTDVRGMRAHVFGSFVATRPFLSREGVVPFLVWTAFSLIALIAAPFPRFGAPLAGLASFPLGTMSALGVLIGAFEPNLGAGPTVAAIVTVAIGAGLVAGWSWRRRHRARAAATGVGAAAMVVGSVVGAFALPGALVGIGSASMGLMSFEEYDTAIAVFVLACAVAVLWLGASLVGLGIAAYRTSPSVGRSSSSHMGEPTEAPTTPTTG
jgi:hypothetical protein